MTPEEQTLERYRNRLLKKVDTLTTYGERLRYLNDQFIKATSKQEVIVLDMLKRLKNGF